MKIQVGMIGCGNISRFYFSGLEKCGASVLWTCDLNLDSAQSCGDKCKARSTADYREILKDKTVNTVIVACTTLAHKDICLAAIDAGKAVICEKTLGRNAQESLEIIQSAIQKKTIFYTAYMKRFIPAVEKAKELFDRIGRIISMQIKTYQPWGDLWAKNPVDGFFHTPVGGRSDVVKYYGGGILLCGGSHLLDLVLYFLGRPTKLYAHSYMPQDRDYDLHAVVILETASGVVQYEALAHPLKKIGFLGDGWDEQISIIGTCGTLTVHSAMWDQVDFKASKLSHYDNVSETVTDYLFDAVSPFDRSVAYFCKHIELGRQGSQSVVTGYEVDELIDHIKLSASTGQAVSVDWRI
jgi:predicted dehydrogenase